MPDGLLSNDGASDGDDTKSSQPEHKPDAAATAPEKVKAAPTSGKKRDAASQILKIELDDLAAEKKRLSGARKAITTKMKKSNRRRRRLLKKLRTTPTEDLVLMIRARERDDTFQRASEMAAEKTDKTASD